MLLLEVQERGPARHLPVGSSEPRYIPPLPGQLELRADYVDQPEIHVPNRARDICVPMECRRPQDNRYRSRINRAGRKPKSIGMKRLNRRERYELWVQEWQAPIVQATRRFPLTVLHCEPGPCAYVGCPKNLYLDVDRKTGAIKLNFPDKEPDELIETCSDRVARRAKELRTMTPTAEVARLMNLTDERTRQLEQSGLKKLGPAVEGMRPID
jgi:hypothetical protein